MSGSASPFIAFDQVCLDLGGRRIISDLDFVIDAVICPEEIVHMQSG